MKKINGKKILSDMKFYNDYSKWRDDLNRYERWKEAAEDVILMHRKHYNIQKNTLLDDYLNSAEELYKDKVILASQRNLQYRGKQIETKNERIYNCVTSFLDSIDKIHKAFFLSLCGCGVTLSFIKKYTSKLPNVIERSKGVKNFVIPDSIEGWADSIGVLMSSFCDGDVPFPEYQGKLVRFDYSEIRPKGSFISGGFKAPGPEGLKQSIERIENIISTMSIGKQLKTIDAYDILMHCANATLSGGVRRAAFAIIVDQTDEELLNAKTNNWRETHKHRERSNNSVLLQRGSFTLDNFKELVSINQGMSDLGFVLANTEDIIYNPCYEVSFSPILNGKTGFQFCNLTEINASALKDKDEKLDKEKFISACKGASTIATLQAGYTNFPYLGSVSEEITRKESLIGVSITGLMDNPELFDEEILTEGVKAVNSTNKLLSHIIGINPAARTTVIKPSGNASVLLGTPSGIHPEHSKRYFRCMQINKNSEIGKWVENNVNEAFFEESQWSSINSDYVVFVPIQNDDNCIFKDEMKGVKHLKKIQTVQKNWIAKGKDIDLCINPHLMNNVSCTVIIDNLDEICSYIFDNQNDFTAVSFLGDFGDKDYPQSPFTSVLNSEQLLEKYGDGVMFASGLIVDGLQYFDNNLWEACEFIINKDKKITGTRTDVLLKTDWIRRAKQFAKNNFKNDLQQTVYCLKDVHLWHKWCKIRRNLKEMNFEEILVEPKYNDVSNYAAQACAGGACEIKTI